LGSMGGVARALLSAAVAGVCRGSLRPQNRDPGCETTQKR
jgi:hypothetical protein